MTLGENIARLRIQKDWSQGDLADALDISRQSVSKWETDASIPELDKLLKLSELFGVTLDELVRGEDAPKAETAAPAAQAVPASFTPQTSSEQEKRHTIVGTILMCIGAVLLLTCLILAGDLLAGLIYGSPFFLCGIICFTVKYRTGLWCGWAAYLCIDLYLRFATGLSWTTAFMTHLWTAQMNYARLAISWVQLLGMLVMIVCTVRSYRTLRLPATKKEGTWLIAGWLAALAFSLMICIGAVMLFQKGTFLIGAQRAAILSTFEPITSIFVGILFLNEMLTPRILLGSAITLVAGVFITLGGKKDEDKEEAAKD